MTTQEPRAQRPAENELAEVIPFDQQTEDDRAALAYLQRECDERGWDLDDVMENGFPVDSYQCPRCAVPPLMAISSGVIETGDGAIHASCGAVMELVR